MLKLNKKGFTLMEMVLVISISVCILSIIKINISNLARTKKEIEINRMVNDLETYRDKALIDKMNIEFRIGIDKKSYTFTDLGKSKTKLLIRELNSGYSIHHNNINSYIVFKSTGAPSKGVTLTIRDGKELNNIIIQPVTGNIRIEKMVK